MDEHSLVVFDGGSLLVLNDADRARVLGKTIQSINDYFDSPLGTISNDTIPDLGPDLGFDFTQNQPFEVCDPDDTPYQPRPCRAEIVQMEEACASGDMAAVQAVFRSEWVEKPADDRIDKDQFASSFKVAIKNDHLAAASFLISVGVMMDLAHFKCALELKAYPFLQLFLEHGFDINEQLSWSEPGPLTAAFHDIELTKWCLARGADPNAECMLDKTPLSIAVAEASFHIIQLLFDHGGSANHGQLLHYAARRVLPDRLRVLDFVLEEVSLHKGPSINDIMYQDRPYCYGLQECIGIGTPLHEAASLGKLDMVEALVARGADPCILNSKGGLVIELARWYGHREVVEYLLPLSRSSPNFVFQAGSTG